MSMLKILPDGAIEMSIPYTLAVSRYGKTVADIMTELGSSSAEEAKKMSTKDFKWALGYLLPADPNLRDYKRFLEHLTKNTQIWLGARGAGFRRWKLLDTIPPQITAKLEERARLICANPVSNRAATTESVAPASAAVTGSDTIVFDAIEDWIRAHPKANMALVRVLKYVFQQLVENSR